MKTREELKRSFNFDIGNQSTTRKQPKRFQLKTEEGDDTCRSQEAFKKIKNLEFQNELFLMEMQHAQRRKEAETSRIQFQLSSIKSDIDFMKSQLQSPAAKSKQCHSIDSERSSDFSSSSSNENSYIKCPIKFKPQEKHTQQQQKIDNYDQIENKFRKLFQISDVNDKLNGMIRSQFNSFHSVQLDLQNNLVSLLLDNTLKLLIDIVEKLNSIKLDSLQFKSYDPFQSMDKNNKRYSTELEFDQLPQEQYLQSQLQQQQQQQQLLQQQQQQQQQSQGNFFENCQKSQFMTPQYKSQQQQSSQRQLSNMMKVKGESSGQTSNNQTVDKKVSISERSGKRTTSQKCQLMPSLKNRQK